MPQKSYSSCSLFFVLLAGRSSWRLLSKNPKCVWTFPRHISFCTCWFPPFITKYQLRQTGGLCTLWRQLSWWVMVTVKPNDVVSFLESFILDDDVSHTFYPCCVDGILGQVLVGEYLCSLRELSDIPLLQIWNGRTCVLHWQLLVCKVFRYFLNTSPFTLSSSFPAYFSSAVLSIYALVPVRRSNWDWPDIFQTWRQLLLSRESGRCNKSHTYLQNCIDLSIEFIRALSWLDWCVMFRKEFAIQFELSGTSLRQREIEFNWSMSVIGMQ